MAEVSVVIMGVSGVGKSTLGSALADSLDRPFIDADDLHSSSNRIKMSQGTPLDDLDRQPWLHQIGREILRVQEQGSAPIVACSALKRKYRDKLRDFDPNIAFLFLNGDAETIAGRISERSHEYMPSSLLSSQFEALDVPVDEPRVLELDIRASVCQLIDSAAEWIRLLQRDLSPLEEGE